MHLMIFYPGGVSTGFPVDMTDDNEVYTVMLTAATVEEGNGNGKTKQREHQAMDGGSGQKVRNRR